MRSALKPQTLHALRHQPQSDYRCYLPKLRVIVQLRDCPQDFTLALVALFLGQIFIFSYNIFVADIISRHTSRPKGFISFITPILKSLMVPVIWLALIGAIYSRIAPFFALNRIFFPTNEEATLKTKQPIRFQGLFKVTNQIAVKCETKSIMWQILLLLFPKLLFFLPKNGWI